MPRLSAALLALALLLCACSSAPPRTQLQSIQVSAAPDANTSSGTQLDIVFVFDATADTSLPAGGADWFAKKSSLKAGLATSIVLVELQLPAPYPATAVPLPAGYAKAIGVYSYASYMAADGQPRCKITPFRSVTLRLQNDHIDCVGQ